MSDYGRATKKRRRSASAASRAIARKARFSVRPTKQLGGSANRCIIPLIVDYDFPLTADLSASFQWNNEGMSISGGAPTTITGLTNLQNTFTLLRVHHVEVTVMPSAMTLDFSNQTTSSGSTNIPFFYDAVEFIDPPGNRTLGNIQSNPTCRSASLNKVLRRTIYPRLQGTSDVVDVGKSDKNQFIQSDNAAENTWWNGYVAYADMKSVTWTYGSMRLSFKVFYECMLSK